MSDDADAVRAHYVEALTRRMQAAPEAVQRVLQGRLQKALAHHSVETASPRPEAVRPRKKALTPLGQLNQHIGATTQPELKSVQAFRETWSRICAEDEVIEAVQRGPENAGPLNSHMLVLRTLGLMRDLSPDYLRRFMAHADTLLWLDRAGERLKQPTGKGRTVRQKKQPGEVVGARFTQSKSG